MNSSAGSSGWTWIAASLAAVYFLVAALFWNGRWSSFFWAIAFGSVAKWLMVVFDEMKKRVWDEADAAERRANVAAALQAAQKLVNGYGAVLEHSSLIASETRLPAPKQQIKDALLMVARWGKLTGVSAEKMGHLRTAYAALADFVPANEAEIAREWDDAIKSGRALSDADMKDENYQRAVKELAERISSASPALEVMQRTHEEFARLIREFDTALAS